MKAVGNSGTTPKGFRAGSTGQAGRAITHDAVVQARVDGIGDLRGAQLHKRERLKKPCMTEFFVRFRSVQCALWQRTLITYRMFLAIGWSHSSSNTLVAPSSGTDKIAPDIPQMDPQNTSPTKTDMAVKFSDFPNS